MMSTTRSDTETTVGRVIGTSVPRKEDRRLVQGQGVFVDDIKRHNMGYVHFVRSPYAHAKIVSIDLTEALEAPGVIGSLTGDEVAILTEPFFQIAPGPGGNIKDYALAVGKARYLGEAVVAIVAETRELARDAAGARRGRVRAAAAVVDARTATDPGTPVIHDEIGSNESWRRRLRVG